MCFTMIFTQKIKMIKRLERRGKKITTAKAQQKTNGSYIRQGKRMK